ncbi:MAG: ExeM/NucH family extracellular endonuclease [Oscillochloridaceae bacterium umkhey_bin13]
MAHHPVRSRERLRLAIIGFALVAMLVSLFGIAPPQSFANGASTITQWNFNSLTPDANTGTGTTDPALGTGTASLVGGTTATFASGSANGGSTDPAGTNDNSGWNVSTFAAQGTENEQRGVQFNVSTVGFENIVVNWDQRHSNTSARHVRFQYSTDGTTFTNLGTLFEASSGDAWFNGRSLSLSGITGVNNNPNFAFRIVAAFEPSTSSYAAATNTSTYAAGGTWRFDMVTVTGEATSTGPVGPSITTEPSSTTITEGETTMLSVVATGTAPLAYQWYQGTAPDTSTPVGTNSASFITPVLTQTTSYWVRVSNSVDSVDSATATVTVTPLAEICAEPFTPAYAIQGNGNAAAITGVVTTQGVVVGDFQGLAPALGGFYLQDVDGDSDPTTSDGIFVFNRGTTTVELGKLVRVTGTAAEFENQTQMGTVTSVLDCGASPAITPVDVQMPFPAPVDGVPYLERYEGMLVRFPQQLFVTEHFQLGRFGQIVMASGDRLYQPTNVVDPGAPANTQQAANNLNRIIVDDELNNQNRDPIVFGRGGNPLSASNTLRGGDSATGMVGVMTFGWAGNSASPNNYRLRPIGALGGGIPNFQATNPRPTARPAVGGTLKVSAFNVLNYFLTLDYPIGNPLDNKCGPLQNVECRGADWQNPATGRDEDLELQRQRTKLLQALLKLNGDVVGLIELENTPGVKPEQDLADGLNDLLGFPVYSFIDTGVIGTDAIKLGFIYNTLTVEPVGDFAILDSTVDPSFDDSRSRPALAQSFRELATGEVFTVINNHLKSKGDSGLLAPCNTNGPGFDPNCDQGDGQGFWSDTRTKAALALVSWIASDPTNSGDPDFMVVGDLNSYAKEDPIAVFEDAGFVNLGPFFGGEKTYSYAFDGQWGNLDHALASPSLVEQVTGAAKYHINADEPGVLDYNVEFKSAGQITSLFAPNEFRTSDHDPVLVGLRLSGENRAPLVSAIATYDTGLGENGAEIISLRGDRAVLSNAGDGSVDILDVSALPTLSLIERIKRPELNGLTSVAIHPSKDLFVAVAGTSSPRFGRAMLFRLSDGTLLAQYPLAVDSASPNGRQPDSVEIAPDGRFAVIAIEAEQVSTVDDGGNGAIVVIDLAAFDPANPVANSVTITTIEFPDIAGVAGVGVGRTHGDAAGAAITNAPGTIEPEGIAFAPDSSMVYLALQENNAIARLSLTELFPATLPVGNVFGLGQVAFFTDLTSGGGYNPSQLLRAYREPDGIRVVEIGGTRYLLTADEGDTRPNPRGGRTMSIFDADTGAFVADLGNQLADLAHQYGLYPDSRSPNGGVEPEMLEVITVDGRVVAAIGLERASSMAFVDMTDPSMPRVFGLVRTGSNPEGVKLVARDGQIYALSANEVGGTVTVATVPVVPLEVTLPYAVNTPRSFGLGAIDADGDVLTATLSLSPVNAGTLSQTSLSGTLAQINAALLNLSFTPATGFFAPATISVSVSDGEAAPVTGTVRLESGLLAPTIIDQPQSIGILVGQTTTLTVTAEGSAPLSYQWYRGETGDTSNPVGTDSPTFTTATLTETTSYWVRVSNAVGSDDSATATVTVTPTPVAPSITGQPASVGILVGQTTTLTVTATGTAPLSYQWYQGEAGVTSTPVGINSPSFTTPALNQTTSYWVRVSNAVDSADSQTATVTVTPMPSEQFVLYLPIIGR